MGSEEFSFFVVFIFSIFLCFLRFSFLSLLEDKGNDCNLLQKWGISLRPRLRRPSAMGNKILGVIRDAFSVVFLVRDLGSPAVRKKSRKGSRGLSAGGPKVRKEPKTEFQSRQLALAMAIIPSWAFF